MNIHVITADIVEYNTYKMEVKAHNISDANKKVFEYNKVKQDKDIQLIRLEVATEKYSNKNSVFKDINLLSVQEWDSQSDKYKTIPIQKVNKDLESESKLKFFYTICIAEFNRYHIEYKTVENIDYAIAMIKSNQGNYCKNLIEINTKIYNGEGSNMLILDSFSK